MNQIFNLLLYLDLDLDFAWSKYLEIKEISIKENRLCIFKQQIMNHENFEICTNLNYTSVCFSSTGFVLVLSKLSAVALASPKGLTKAWNSSPLATFRPRPVFSRPAEWRPPYPPFSRSQMTLNRPKSRREQVQGPEGLQSGPDHNAPPWTWPRMGHHQGASPRQYQKHPVSTPVTTCRNRSPSSGRWHFARQQEESELTVHIAAFACLHKYMANVWVCLPVTVA